MFSLTAFAAEPAPKAAAPKNNFKLYGFIRNFFIYDSRESVSGTGDLFYYLPKDVSLNQAGEDVNATSSFRFLALTACSDCYKFLVQTVRNFLFGLQSNSCSGLLAVLLAISCSGLLAGLRALFLAYR